MRELRHSATISGSICVPGDKSISHRAIMLGSIAEGITHIKGFLCAEDCLSTISCFRKMGVKIEIDGTNVTVHGVGMNNLRAPTNTLDTGNSGTTTRIMTGLLAGQRFDCTVNGDSSIQKRPMKRITEPLALLGAKIDTKNGCCPMNIHGTSLHGYDITIPVASAQVKSALLMAGLYASGTTSVTEPYLSRNHTELMLKAFGADISSNGATASVSHCDKLTACDISVPADISSAAFFIVATLICKGSTLTIKNVGVNPTRTGITDILREMGGNITYSNKKNDVEPTCDLTITSSTLHGVTIGGEIIPRLIDELPVIAVAALFASGTTIIKDAAELKVKETNRISVMCEELKKCGADVKETDDGMIINGGKKLCGANFASHSDHRIAMSMAVLALAIEENCTLDDESAVSISYPTFFKDLDGIVK